MNRFVLDASVVLTWCFPDEQSQKAEIVGERIAQGGSALVTAFWPHEVLNALLVGERRRRITAKTSMEFLFELQGLAVRFEVGDPAGVFSTVNELCRKHNLSSYDAAYLELAMRNRVPLATVDGDLERAARAEGVRLL